VNRAEESEATDINDDREREKRDKMLKEDKE